MKIRPEHVGNFVRVYYSQDYGCLDGVLVEEAGDLVEVYFIGLKVKEIVEAGSIVAIGPALTALVPRF
jgi:hypothetical protein